MTIMIPKYNNLLFKQIFETDTSFVSAVNGSFAKDCLTVDNLKLLYGLLYARYGNSPVANDDINQSKAIIYSVIYRFGPAWQKKVEVQSKLRGLTDEDICAGSKAIYNKAYNPSDDPTQNGLEEINTINEQNTQKLSRSKIEGYGLLLSLLKNDVTTEFIEKFKEAFRQFVVADNTILYDDGEEGE